MAKGAMWTGFEWRQVSGVGAGNEHGDKEPHLQMPQRIGNYLTKNRLIGVGDRYLGILASKFSMGIQLGDSLQVIRDQDGGYSAHAGMRGGFAAVSLEYTPADDARAYGDPFISMSVETRQGDIYKGNTNDIGSLSWRGVGIGAAALGQALDRAQPIIEAEQQVLAERQRATEL